MNRRTNKKLTPSRLVSFLDERLPEDLRDPSRFEQWFEPWRRKAMVAAQEVFEAVNGKLATERERVRQREGLDRQVWRITGEDGRSLLKAVGSVRSKLGREFWGQKLPDGRLSEEQVRAQLLKLPDLGRFRIVGDFSCDIDYAKRVLLGKGSLLLGRYRVGSLKDYVHDFKLRRPEQGHRAFQFSVAVEVASQPVFVEIQLMTALQDIWDRRNHPLYEWRREGGESPVLLMVRDVALSEALYLVDMQATQNWLDFLKARSRERRRA